MFPGLFLILEVPLSLAYGPSIFTVSSDQFSLSSGSPAPASPFRDPCEDSGAMQIIQNNLSFKVSWLAAAAASTCNLHPPLPGNIPTHSPRE